MSNIYHTSLLNFHLIRSGTKYTEKSSNSIPEKMKLQTKYFVGKLATKQNVLPLVN